MRPSNETAVTFAGKSEWRHSVMTGGDRFVMEVYRALSSRGLEVRLLDEPRFPLRRVKSVRLANVWSLVLIGWYLGRRRGLRGGVVFQDYSSRTRFVMANGALRRFARCRIVSLVQGFYHQIPSRAYDRVVEETVARIYMRELDLLIANSRSTAAEACRLGAAPERTRVVYPGLDEAFMKVLPVAQARMNSPARILFVGGQCKPVKGLEYLVSALGILKSRETELVLVGEVEGPDYAGYVRRLKCMSEDLGVRNRVKFTGLVASQERLQELYSSSDIFVLPSLWEGYGVAALEAMCFGLPVVATTAGGTTEIVRHGETGFLVPPRSAGAIAEALGRLLDSEGLWRRMSAAAAARAKRIRRDWRTAGEESAALIEELCRGGIADEAVPLGEARPEVRKEAGRCR